MAVTPYTLTNCGCSGMEPAGFATLVPTGAESRVHVVANIGPSSGPLLSFFTEINPDPGTLSVENWTIGTPGSFDIVGNATDQSIVYWVVNG